MERMESGFVAQLSQRMNFMAVRCMDLLQGYNVLEQPGSPELGTQWRRNPSGWSGFGRTTFDGEKLKLRLIVNNLPLSIIMRAWRRKTYVHINV